jgi:hypothetical protein
MKKQPQVNPVEVEKDGVLYSGTYTVQNGIITVSYEFREKRTQVGDTPPKIMAQILLSEILAAIGEDGPPMEP